MEDISGVIPWMSRNQRQMRETYCGEVSPKWSTFGETDICFKRLFTATDIQMERYVPE
jgi:hypothetical protein